MRILHVAYIYPPTPKVADGITNVIYNVTRELARRGHEVAVYASNLLDLHSKNVLPAKHLVANGVNVFYSRCLWPYKTFIFTPSMIPLLGKNLKSFDIIHIHDCRSFQGISAYLFAKRSSVPYVFQPHGSYLSSLPDLSIKKIARLALDKSVSWKIVKDASKIIALNQVEAEQYRDVDVPVEKISIIPNGIDLSEYTCPQPKGSFKKKFGINDDKKIILYLGRIHKTKGIDFLMRAYARLAEDAKHNDAVLVIAGPDDGYLGEITRLTNHLKIANKSVFVGMLSEKEKLSAYVDANIVVNVEPKNVFGLVPLEAAACSAPVIVSKGNAISEIVCAGEFGYSVDYGDIISLASLLKELSTNDELTAILGEKGRKYVFNNFSWTEIVKRYEQMYEEIVGRKCQVGA